MSLNNRPIIKVPLSGLDKGVELISLVLLCGLWVFTIYAYSKFPDIIPVHFNAAGKADRYGSKMTIFILAVVATIIFAAMSWLNKYPHLFNYMQTITMENALQQYRMATRILRIIKIWVLIVFLLIILFTYLTVTGRTNGLGSWFIPVSLAILFIPTVVMIISSLRKK